MRTVLGRPVAPILLGLGLVAVLAIVILFMVLGGQKPETGTVAATPSPTALASASAVPHRPMPTPGQRAGGVPTKVGGEAVLRGSRLKATIQASGDVHSFLAGGWLHKHPPAIYCAVFQSPWAVETCGGVALYANARGGRPIWIGPGDVGVMPRNFREVTRPVILRIHTHDSRCNARDHGCELRPVVLQVVWLGPTR